MTFFGRHPFTSHRTEAPSNVPHLLVRYSHGQWQRPAPWRMMTWLVQWDNLLKPGSSTKDEEIAQLSVLKNKAGMEKCYSNSKIIGAPVDIRYKKTLAIPDKTHRFSDERS